MTILRMTDPLPRLAPIITVHNWIINELVGDVEETSDQESPPDESLLEAITRGMNKTVTVVSDYLQPATPPAAKAPSTDSNANVTPSNLGANGQLTLSPAVVAAWKAKGIKMWIAGGAICSSITGDTINDYDVFTDKPDELEQLFNDAFTQTFTNGFVTNYSTSKGKVQLVKRFSPESAEAIFSTFDFTIVSGAYSVDGFDYHERLFIDIAQRRLVVENLHFPLSTFERMTKYCRRGYQPCPIGMMKVCRMINSMQIDWDNPDENQLTFYADGTPRFTGVD